MSSRIKMLLWALYVHEYQQTNKQYNWWSECILQKGRATQSECILQVFKPTILYHYTGGMLSFKSHGQLVSTESECITTQGECSHLRATVNYCPQSECILRVCTYLEGLITQGMWAFKGHGPQSVRQSVYFKGTQWLDGLITRVN